MSPSIGITGRDGSCGSCALVIVFIVDSFHTYGIATFIRKLYTRTEYCIHSAGMPHELNVMVCVGRIVKVMGISPEK